MKKILFVFLLCFAFVFVGCTSTPKINVKETTVELKVGDTYEIEAEVTGASDSLIEYVVADPTILSIEDAKVTALKAGTTTVTLKLKAYDVVAVISFNVAEKEVEVNEFTVTFKDYDGTVLKEEKVEEGKAATAPENPTREGYTFTGWDTDFSKVEQDLEVTAQYEANEDKEWYEKYDLITVAEALQIAAEAGEKGTAEKYYVYGVIETVSNPTYGEMTINDGTGSLYVYGTYSSDGEKRYPEVDPRPVAGDAVVLYGALKMYKGSAEMDKGWIMEFVHEDPEINENDYPTKTVLETRNSESNTKVKVEGVVAKITHANGFIPNGFFLIDNTSAIYVYGEIAAQVKEGNKVVLAGEHVDYVPENDIDKANQFNYKGCCQIANAVLISNDNGNHEFDKSWIQETTVKDILDTPLTEAITSQVFKVNAYIKKAPGAGFVNYYINDVDGLTGSYVYTQCNGSDYEWLDEYDGKICTVYLSALNAKLSSSGHIYRFIPIAVSYDEYKFDTTQAPNFVLKYYVMDNFLTEYKSNPALELPLEVSNEILGFEGVKLTYLSSDESVISFDITTPGVAVMNVVGTGEAKITVTAEYNGLLATKSIDIKTNMDILVEAVSVVEAIAADLDTVVQVKGVVAASLVNQDGFYLIDETGVIAVKTTTDVISQLKLGDEVVMKGTRVQYLSSKGQTVQTAIIDAELVINYYGNHEYSKASFDYSKTIEDLKNEPVTGEHTHHVYVFDAKIHLVEQTYFSNYYLQNADGSVEFLLYASSGSQYSWLKEYVGKTITVEVAMCDWNNRGYRACVLAIVVDGVTIVNDLNFR